MEQPSAEINHLVDHFFRHEHGKMVSVLTKILGSQNIDLAEDVVQDALVEALNQWQYGDIPENPSGWMFRVAKNKALNQLKREQYKREYSSEAAYLLQSDSNDPLNALFSEQEIRDDQLRMIFTCCHPAITPDSQVALALKTLCGFSIPEIAKAFLTTEENINKRLVRARQKIRDDHIPFEVPSGKDLEQRLQTVLETIYLLFNEGYSASKGDDIIRYELCEEAIRLAQMLAGSSAISRKGNVYALLALMFLNASRFRARQDKDGNLLTMAEQDRSLWDRQFMGSGFYYLQQSMQNNELSMYHILAAISANYCAAQDYASTDWNTILSLYNNLLEFDRSPLILLNRAIALAKVDGPEKGLSELEQIENNPALKFYHLFYSTRAEFYIQLNDFSHAVSSLEKAMELAPLQAERDLLKKKLDASRNKVT